MADYWTTFIEKEAEFLDSGKGEFRHNASFIAVSSIAEQYYCEYKLENEFKFGEVPTEAKDTGTELHDELMPTKPITGEEFAKLVGGNEPSFAVMRVWGEVGGIKIVGMPDHIVWKSGKPLWLMELKTTKSDPKPLWEDQENQVRIYGLLLDKMGLDCSKLQLAVVRLKVDELSDDEKGFCLQEVSGALMDNRVQELEAESNGSMKVHILKHDLMKAEGAVVSKSGYWLGEREPTSSTSVAKCRACEFRVLCPKSLDKP